MKILDELYEVIEDRQKNPKEGSYVCKLLNGGVDKTLKKISEEAGEVVIAAKNPSKSELVWEIADLWFHTLVLMFQSGVTLEDVAAELQKRRK